MKLLIMGLNYHPEPVGIGPFTTGMSEFFAAEGDRIEVQAAVPFYPSWQLSDGFANIWQSETRNGVSITRNPIYIPANPTGPRRLAHLASFTLTSFFPTLVSSLRMRADVVMCIAPSLMSVPVAWLAAKLSGAKLWIHIQDFEVEAAVATGLLSEKGAVSKIANWVERRLLRRAEIVSTISPAMCLRLRSKGVAPARIVEFRNWADIDAISPLERASEYRSRWGIATPHVVLYSGNIANKQGIEIIVEAATLLRHRDDLTFVICGNGPNRANLEAAAEEAKVSNIQFQDLQPREALNELLGLATVHILPQIADAADLVLPSKLANMLASGRPVIATAEKGTGLADEVEGCGTVVPPGDARAVANAIEQLLDDAEMRRQLGSAARHRARQRWSKGSILDRLRQAVQDAIRPRSQASIEAKSP